MAGAILNFGESGTGGGGGGTAYSVRLYGDPRSGGGGFRDSGTACMFSINGFPLNNGNDLYLDGFDSNLGQVTIFFDVALTTPFPDLKDPLYYYVECLSDSRLDKITLLSQQNSSDGWGLSERPMLIKPDEDLEYKLINTYFCVKVKTQGPHIFYWQHRLQQPCPIFFH